jgi:hypothetical protein
MEDAVSQLSYAFGIEGEVCEVIALEVRVDG